jgi:hypothetical protein
MNLLGCVMAFILETTGGGVNLLKRAALPFLRPLTKQFKSG